METSPEVRSWWLAWLFAESPQSFHNNVGDANGGRTETHSGTVFPEAQGMSTELLREHARAIWDAAVAAAKPEPLMDAAAKEQPLAGALSRARRIIVVGGGKAGAAMAAALEKNLADRLDRVTGVVNVPAEAVRPLEAIRLHAARPAGTNEPTSDGVTGVEEMLRLVAAARPEDVVVCLLSGGGSALLPAPADGISLADKQAVTRLLHACGATIGEMNAVRKHLSLFKGGGLAQACRGCELHCLIISDVIGDPLDVIASGPTAPDPTRFGDALAVLVRYDLIDRVPPAVRNRLTCGARGELPETMKRIPRNVHNRIIANNERALQTAQEQAEGLGYRVLNLGPHVAGETQHVANTAAGILRSIVSDGQPVAAPACVLIGGETTVTLGPNPGKGGRNTEFVLAALLALKSSDADNYVVLSGGTDGEDGPTDAAGALGDPRTLRRAVEHRIDAIEALRRHDSYPLFDATGDLLRTGLTDTNVMDVRVLLVRGK
jgi:glycerate 2-kinase